MAMADVQAEIAATKAALSGLRAAVMLISPPEVRVSDRTEHILRLGQIWLDAHKTESFSAALGFERVRTYGRAGSLHPEYQRMSDEHRRASGMGFQWNAFRRHPPMSPKDKTYRRFLGFFSQHWPSDLEWPRDIPRPASTTNTGRAA